ncbi:hypothetical protein HBI13_135880 [Parastagonospora nodorum]|nr:hypothetical protein HBI13_135880 [Parastagonospora nodorum]
MTYDLPLPSLPEISRGECDTVIEAPSQRMRRLQACSVSPASSSPLLLHDCIRHLLLSVYQGGQSVDLRLHLLTSFDDRYQHSVGPIFWYAKPASMKNETQFMVTLAGPPKPDICAP